MASNQNSKTDDIANDCDNEVDVACSGYRVLTIAALSLCFGAVTNHWLYANANKSYTGTLAVKTLSVRAPVEGILETWELEEGAQVDPQSLLCKLVDGKLDHKIQAKNRELARLNARKNTLLAEVDIKLQEHVRQLDREIYATELQAANLFQKKHDGELEVMAWKEAKKARSQNQNDSSGKKFVQIQPLFNPSFDGQVDALLKEEAAINAVETTTAQLEICAQRLEMLKAQKTTLLGNVQQAAGLSEIEIQLHHVKAELVEFQKQKLKQNVFTSNQGTVANFRLHPGDQIQEGEVLADLYQMNDAFVIANVPCSAMHKFELDATVKCKFPNGEKRTGVVTHIAVGTKKTANSNNWGTDPTVPVRIEQTGALWPSMPVGGRVGIIR